MQCLGGGLVCGGETLDDTCDGLVHLGGRGRCRRCGRSSAQERSHGSRKRRELVLQAPRSTLPGTASRRDRRGMAAQRTGLSSQLLGFIPRRVDGARAEASPPFEEARDPATGLDERCARVSKRTVVARAVHGSTRSGSLRQACGPMPLADCSKPIKYDPEKGAVVDGITITFPLRRRERSDRPNSHRGGRPKRPDDRDPRADEAEAEDPRN